MKSCAWLLPSFAMGMNKVVLNVSGKRFTTFWETLQKFPESRLGKLTKTSENYDAENEEFFYDRNPKLMTSLLDLYRNGELHLPSNLCSVGIKQELIFWGISEDLISECCWKTFVQGNDDKAIVDVIDASLGSTPDFTLSHSLKKRISLTLECPAYSKFAMFWNAINMFMVVTITVTVMIGTLDTLRTGLPELHRDNHTVSQMEVLLSTDILPWLYYMEIACLVFFSVDMLARFFSCSSKKKFVKNGLNIIEFFVDWVMWTALILDLFGDVLGHNTDLRIIIHILKALFCLNILRLWHFVRQYKMMKILILTFKASFNQLFLLCIGLIITVVMYATLIYFIEIVMSTDTFQSIPIAIWWAVITMTTVGYGDFHPQSAPGYIIGVLCSLSGILLLAMPVAIIASNFTAYYSNMSSREQRIRRKKFLNKKAATNSAFLYQEETELEDFDSMDTEVRNCSVKQNGSTRNRISPDLNGKDIH